jgi:cell division septation protein DedD
MGFRQIFPILVSIVLLLASAAVLFSQDDGRQGAGGAEDPLLTEARTLWAEGRLQDAAVVYTKWLAEHTGHPDFGLILIEAADSQLSVERALELLRVYTPRVQDPRQRELCRASQIDLLEMLGRTEQALGLLRSFPPTPWWLYRQGQLLYQEGLADEAEKSLQEALKALLSDEIEEIKDNIEQNNALEARIRLLQARILLAQERSKEAENLFRLLSAKYGDTALGPRILLAYYEHLLAQGRIEEADEQLDALTRKFPDSPELALARAVGDRTDGGEGRIGYAPIPSRLLPNDLASPREGSGADRSREQPDRKPAAESERQTQLPPPAQTGAPPQPSAEAKPPVPAALVQTGSFRDRENAEYMVKDLKTSGFEAGIVEKQIGVALYYRVVIGPLMAVEQAQAVLMKLKDAGFEGVLLFPE